jgi:hypothetical protein
MLRPQNYCCCSPIRPFWEPQFEPKTRLRVRRKEKALLWLAPVNVQSPQRIERRTLRMSQTSLQSQHDHISRSKLVAYRLRHPAAILRFEWRVCCPPKLSCTQVESSYECMRLQFLHLRRVRPNDHRAEFTNSIPVVFGIRDVESRMRHARGRQVIRRTFSVRHVPRRRRTSRRSPEENYKRVDRCGHAVGHGFVGAVAPIRAGQSPTTFRSLAAASRSSGSSLHKFI